MGLDQCQLTVVRPWLILEARAIIDVLQEPLGKCFAVLSMNDSRNVRDFNPQPSGLLLRCCPELFSEIGEPISAMELSDVLPLKAKELRPAGEPFAQRMGLR